MTWSSEAPQPLHFPLVHTNRRLFFADGREMVALTPPEAPSFLLPLPEAPLLLPLHTQEEMAHSIPGCSWAQNSGGLFLIWA